jgi:SAM-dependent methyltransferase
MRARGCSMLCHSCRGVPVSTGPLACSHMAVDPYRDERFVERYDIDDAPGDDHAYYRALADAIEARKIIDLGCGTGLLTRALATPGRAVIGVDPSATMLSYARRQPGAEAVTWIHGDATVLDCAGDVDLAVSSGNTMMHISPEACPTVLGSLRAALRPGGVISFDTRNPEARAWERWNPAETSTVRDTSFGHLREWLVWRSTRTTTVLHFRSAEDITADLERAGFTDVDVRGGWHDEPVTADCRVLVFRATRST